MLTPWHQRIQGVTLHHAGVHFTGNDKDAVDLIRVIRENHKAKNWGSEKYPAYAPDITYHVAINPNTGRVFYLNSINNITWHDGDNFFWLGVMILGDGRYQHWNKNIERGLDAIFSAWKILDIHKNSFRAHRDAKPTICPGDLYYAGMIKYKKSPFLREI